MKQINFPEIMSKIKNTQLIEMMDAVARGTVVGRTASQRFKPITVFRVKIHP